jgi:hypothetical protein
MSNLSSGPPCTSWKLRLVEAEYVLYSTYNFPNAFWGNSRHTLLVAEKIDDSTAHNTQYRYMIVQQTKRPDHIIHHNVRHQCSQTDAASLGS